MKDTTRVGSRGQVVILKPIRDKLNLKEHDELSVTLRRGVIILKPARRYVPVAYKR